MNWPLFWALLFALGIIVGNILLLKQSAKLKMPKPKKPYAEWDDDKEPSSHKQVTPADPAEISQQHQNRNNHE